MNSDNKIYNIDKTCKIYSKKFILHIRLLYQDTELHILNILSFF